MELESRSPTTPGGARIQSAARGTLQAASGRLCPGRRGSRVLDPDQRVRDAIPLVFATFRECWSVRQTFDVHVPPLVLDILADRFVVHRADACSTFHF